MPVLRLIHCILHATLLLKLQDPEKGRTGSSGVDGAFVRGTLHVVSLSAESTTTYSLMPRAMAACAGLFPAPPPCYPSEKFLIGKKSDHTDRVVR